MVKSKMKKERKRDRLLMSFLQELIQLEVEVAAGVAVMLGVATMTKEGDPLPSEEIMQSFCAQFDRLTTKRKKEVIQLLKRARR